MRLSLVRCIAVLIVALTAPSLAQADQPTGIELNNQGVSYVYPVLASEGWSLTRFSNQGAHKGDDYFAQDWARSCGQTRGQTVYAGISGTVTIAGWQNGYGNTVVIYDSGSDFALRYGHLDSIAVSYGQTVVAGETKLGTVGNTGSVTGSCRTDPGAHLHLTLYKNVASQHERPITSVRASGNATIFAADFRYVCPLPLARTTNDLTVYAIENGRRKPVSWFVFNQQGWNFDKSKSFFNPVQIWSNSQLRRYPPSYFYTPREGSLIRGDRDQTVFLIENQTKHGLSFDEFSCRRFNFGDVITVSQSECDNYPKGADLRGCGGGDSPPTSSSNDEQAMRDFNLVLNRDWRFVSVVQESFDKNLNLDNSWEYRWIDVSWTQNRRTTAYHATAKHNRSIRAVGIVDPDTGQWTGWQTVQ